MYYSAVQLYNVVLYSSELVGTRSELTAKDEASSLKHEGSTVYSGQCVASVLGPVRNNCYMYMYMYTCTCTIVWLSSRWLSSYDTYMHCCVYALFMATHKPAPSP